MTGQRRASTGPFGQRLLRDLTDRVVGAATVSDRDGRFRAAAAGADVQRLLVARVLRRHAVETELGPAVLLREVDRILSGGGPS